MSSNQNLCDKLFQIDPKDIYRHIRILKHLRKTRRLGLEFMHLELFLKHLHTPCIRCVCGSEDLSILIP